MAWIFFSGSQIGPSCHCMCLVLPLLESLWVADPLYLVSSWSLILFFLAPYYSSVTYYLLPVWSSAALHISPLLSNCMLVVSIWACSSWFLHFLVLPCQLWPWFELPPLLLLPLLVQETNSCLFAHLPFSYIWLYYSVIAWIESAFFASVCLYETGHSWCHVVYLTLLKITLTCIWIHIYCYVRVICYIPYMHVGICIYVAHPSSLCTWC